jgi:hypothetical protein
MATCPCNEEVEIDVNPLEAEEGDIVSCPECGATLSIISVSPLEFELIDDDDLDDEDDDDEDEDDDWDDDEDDDFDDDEDDDL